MDLSAIEDDIRESIATKERFLSKGLDPLRDLLARARSTIEAGGKLLFCGNGGSACDAAHAACELVGWFLAKQRRPLAAIALGHEVPTLTAIANDAGYDEVFARHLEAVGRKGDLLIGISTSGGSTNVLAAIARAKQLGIASVALTGATEGTCATAADLWVPVPSTSTPRVQECHLLIVHLLCGYLESSCT
jgi:D-sedoheptulose 7-phosphate isomerase